MARKARKERTDAEKTADFKRIAAKKVRTIQKNLAQLGQMAGNSRYKHTPGDATKMQAAVAEAVEACFAAFAGKKSATATFEL